MPQQTNTLKRLVHPADRDTFRRQFCHFAESQFYHPPAAEVIDCAALLRFSYREALRQMKMGMSPLFSTPEGQRHFADAQTLRQQNCAFISREWKEARPGDLFFYLQLEQDQPFHAMIFLGKSQWEPDANRYVIYHTGSKPGEIRRPTIEQLILHPEPRWRPVHGNPSFLGVHRWRILT